MFKLNRFISAKDKALGDNAPIFVYSFIKQEPYCKG